MFSGQESAGCHEKGLDDGPIRWGNADPKHVPSEVLASISEYRRASIRLDQKKFPWYLFEPALPCGELFPDELSPD